MLIVAGVDVGDSGAVGGAVGVDVWWYTGVSGLGRGRRGLVSQGSLFQQCPVFLFFSSKGIILNTGEFVFLLVAPQKKITEQPQNGDIVRT